MAVMVAFLHREFDVVRVKNRFESDEVESVSAERTLAEFYAAETLGVDIDSTNESAPKSEKMYRDVLVNLRPKGSDFICEVQLTLTGISILKKSEQKIYTLARMTFADELLDTFVFSAQPERVMSTQPSAVPLPSRSNVFTTSAVSAAETAANAPDKIRKSGRENMNMHHEVESDLGLRKMDIEHGKVEMLAHTNVAPDTVPSKTAAISFDAALSNRHGKYSEKPRPGETSREVEPATNADFQRSFYSCACRPCSTSVGAVQAEVSETAA